MRLHQLKPRPGSKHRNKRLGCGESSGKGKTSGKGHKGQKSRSGASIRPGFEGGQMPLYRRLPRRGFNNKNFKTQYATVNVSDLETFFDAGATVDESTLREKGLVQGKRWDGVKVLGNGELAKSLKVTVDAYTGTAREKIEKAGGTASVVEPAERPAKEAKEKAPAAKKAAPAKAKAEKAPEPAPKAEAPAEEE